MNNEPEPEVAPVVKVARDLTEITTLAAELAAEAVEAANDRLMPGGKATVALAHVANLEAWENRVETIERTSSDDSHIADEDDDWEPPLQTLCFWSEQWRAEHDAEYDQRPTIASEANFLRWCLNWAWDHEVHWDDFAADIRRTRLRLEDIVHAGTRVHRTRVPCIDPECETRPRLIKLFGRSEDDDTYKCPACKRRYDKGGFARAKMDHLASQGADRHVKMQDARDAIDRPERTFRKWLRFWYVRSYVDAKTGQTWVWWPDVRDMDVKTPKRNRLSA